MAPKDVIPVGLQQFPIDEKLWYKTYDFSNESFRTSIAVTTYVVQFITHSTLTSKVDRLLWQDAHEDFEGWTEELFALAAPNLLRDFRTFMTHRGVWLKPVSGGRSYAKTWKQFMEESTQHLWTEEEIQGILDDGLPLQSRVLGRRTGASLTQSIEATPQVEARQPPPPSATPLPARDGNFIATSVHEQELKREYTAPIWNAFVPTGVTPHPALSPDIKPVYDTTAYSKQLSDMQKMLNDNQRKYGGEIYEVLDYKLYAFYECCTKVALPYEAYHLGFSSILRDRALDYFYTQCAGRRLSFATMRHMMQVHFETEARRQGYLSEWRSINYHSVQQMHPDKDELECFELLCDKIRTLQKGLSYEYQQENNLRDQVLNACKGIPECRFALFKPATTFEGVCAELRASIATAINERKNDALMAEHYWVDRKYEGSRTRFGRFGRDDKPLPNGRFGHNEKLLPTRQRTSSVRTGAPQQRTNRNEVKKCFICKKEGCWSTNHSLDERRRASAKFKEQLIVEGEMSEEEADQFVQEEEEEAEAEEGEGIAHEQMLTELGPINGPQALSALLDQCTMHIITREDVRTPSVPYEEIFTFEERYSAAKFQGIMPDSGASGVSTAGEPQFQALQREDPSIVLVRTGANDHTIRFGKGTADVKGTAVVHTPVGPITFHIVSANTPFLYCIQDMDKMNVRFDNLKNVLVQGKNIVPIVRKWGHPWMLLHREQAIAQAHLTEMELKQLHRRFGHPSVRKLTQLLEKAGQDDVNTRTIEHLTKYCSHCQLNAKSPGRFKFSIKEDAEFNYAVVVDIMYIDGSPVLHLVDEATAFNAARFLKEITAKATWDAVRTCWIDTYQGPPDYLVHDAGKNFASYEFKQSARTMGTEVKEVPVEAHNSIGKVERYHVPLRRAYEIMREELQEERISRDAVLQIAVKAVNDTAGPNGLVPTLLVFGAYPRINNLSTPSPSMVVRAEAIRKAMTELRKLNAQRQVKDALEARNGPTTSEVLNLPLQSDVRVWREKKKWQGPFKLLAIEGEECIVQTASGPTRFRSTVVKPFRQEEIPEVEVRITPPPPARRMIPQVVIPYRRAEAFLTKKEKDDYTLATELRTKGIITTEGGPFEKSQQQEIESLMARGVFEIVRYDPTKHKGRIFNTRVVNEVKGKTTEAPYEKSRMVVQGYNDTGKESVLTQAPTVQRASQRLLEALIPSLMAQGMEVSVRDITQAYPQSVTELNRTILAHLPKQIQHLYPPDMIIIIRKPLYGIAEAGTHWWATYHGHHKEKLNMTTSVYDPCLMITTTEEAFAMVALQTDDTLILGDKAFHKKEEEELHKAGFIAKPVEKLSANGSLIFNGCKLIQEEDQLLIVQKGQGQKIKQVDMASKHRTSDYREQRARGAYLSSICQPEASFDLSVAAQHQDPTDEDVKALNKRLQWQLDNLNRGICYIPLNLSTIKLFVYVDGSFANNKDLSSQIGFIIFIANEDLTYDSFKMRGNLIHWSSTKSKRVTRSVLASEIYAMVAGVDMAIVLSQTLGAIMKQLRLPPLPTVVCTDSYSLYDCLVKLGTTKEKRLMIDIMALRQSYERRELAEVRWIKGDDNPADSMTKTNPNKALEKALNLNELIVRIEGWVVRKEK
jgi:polyhydroxyalkanoate synthesis regulator phasin